MRGCSTPCLANLSASSFPTIFVGSNFVDGDIVMGGF